MPEFVSVRQHEQSQTVVSVTKERAEGLGLEVLDQPATNKHGKPLGPRQLTAPDRQLRGKALDDALEAAGLSKGGTVDEKRQRLADHHNPDPADNTGGDDQNPEA